MQTSRDEKRFSSDPFRIIRSEEYRSGRDVLRLADAAKWRLRFKHFPHIAFGVTAGDCSFGDHHARIDGVHANFPWAELLRERSRDSIDRGFCRVVDHPSW